MPRSVFTPRIVGVLAAVLSVPSPLPAVDPNYLPDDTEAVVVVNLKQLLTAEAVRSQPDARGELEAVLGRFAGLHAVQKYLAEAGLSAFHDAQTVTFAFTVGKEPGRAAIILEGAAVAGKLAAAAKGGALKVVKAGDHVIYEVTPRGEKRMFATPVGRSTLIAAPTAEALTDALDRDAGSKKSALKKEVRAALESVGDGQSVAFVATGPALARFVGGAGLPNAETAVAFLKTLDVVAGGVTLDKDIQFQLAVNAESEEAAKKLAESATSATRLLLTLARQTAETDGNYLPVVDVVKGLRFSSEGTGVRFRGGMTLDTVEKLLANFPVARQSKDRK
jgi:hypothetical protein